MTTGNPDVAGPGPRHGYQLRTEFEAVTGGVWPLNIGQVYTTRDRLARDGLVATVRPGGGPGRDDRQKVDALTGAGRRELGAWWNVVPATQPPPRDELILKILRRSSTGAIEPSR